MLSTIDYSRTGTIKNCLWEKIGEIYLKHLWLFGSWYWTLELIIGGCLGLTVSIGLRIKAIRLILFKHCGYKVLQFHWKKSTHICKYLWPCRKYNMKVRWTRSLHLLISRKRQFQSRYAGLYQPAHDTLCVRCKYFNGFKREIFDRNTLSCFPGQKKKLSWFARSLIRKTRKP